MSCKKTAQQSVHLTLGILRQSQAVSYALSFFRSDGFAVPAPAQVTQTVGRQIKNQRQNRLWIASVVSRLAQKENSFFEFGHLLAVVSESSFVFSISVLVLVEVLANCRLLLFGESFGQVILAQVLFLGCVSWLVFSGFPRLSGFRWNKTLFGQIGYSKLAGFLRQRFW